MNKISVEIIFNFIIECIVSAHFIWAYVNTYLGTKSNEAPFDSILMQTLLTLFAISRASVDWQMVGNSDSLRGAKVSWNFPNT